MPAQASKQNRETFRRLLKEYKRISELLPILAHGDRTWDAVDDRLLDSLSEELLLPRYRKFNVDYVTSLGREKLAGRKIQQLEAELKRTPLSDLGRRPQLELSLKAVKDEHAKFRKLIFFLSNNANESLSEAIATMTDEQKKRATVSAPPPPPKMPGVFGGLREDRLKLKDTEKYNLTPVDDEFYKSALGKKLETDLGGRAQAWSYDYATDELYVKVGNDVGKVFVKQDGTARMIRTRVGADFMEPRGSDIKVDMLTAKGKFLTGNANDESLFGKYEKPTPAVQPEPMPAGHSANDGHDHSGHSH